jgi:hypothetical protein
MSHVRKTLAAGALGALLSLSPAWAEFRVEDAPAPARPEPAQMKPGTIYFSDRRGEGLGEGDPRLVRFEDWARARGSEKELLSLYPSYAEPTINVTANGLTKRYKEKLHVYVAEARFLLPKPARSLDLARFTDMAFLEKVDPTIKHRTIGAGDVVPAKDPEEAHNRHPQRAWCEARPQTLCIQSRYALEGRLPLGIRLANKLEESGKKITEFIEFQSELRVVPREEIDEGRLSRLTGVSTPVVGALEQNLFHVNQMMQFGKFLAVFQEHPTDPGKTVATALMALGVETDVLEKKKEYEAVPVLRNMVPSQVLLGNSSFNTGESISAGLPGYARNRAKAIAEIMERG